jgi:hypothetical protein
LIHVFLHAGLFVLGLAVIWLFRRRTKSDTGSLMWAYILAYFIRFIFILALHVFSRDGLFLLDDRNYNDQGRYLAHVLPALNLASSSDLTNQLGTHHVAYPLIVGFVYFVGGLSILSAKLLNAFVGAVFAPVIYWLSSALGRDDRGLPLRAAWIAAVFPFDIAWAGFLLRDTILEVVFTCLLAATVAFLRQRSYLFLGLTLLTLYIIDSFRFYAVFVWAGAMTVAALAWLARRIASRFKGNHWVYFGGITAVGVCLVTMSLPLLLRQFQFVRIVALQIAGLGEGGDATPLSFGLNLGFLASLFGAVFAYFLGPFPWVFWGNADPINYLFYPGMYVIYALFPFFVAGFWKMIRGLDPTNIFLVAAMVLHGLIEIYVFQGASRQRMMTDAVFILCAAVAWPARQRFAARTRLAYASLILIAAGHTILRAFKG